MLICGQSAIRWIAEQNAWQLLECTPDAIDACRAFLMLTSIHVGVVKRTVGVREAEHGFGIAIGRHRVVDVVVRGRFLTGILSSTNKNLFLFKFQS